MAFKFELEQWQRACDAFDENNYDEALKTFISIADNAKMHFNIGSIFSILNDHKRAITAFNRAILKDPYFAVAYFQRGVSLFLLGNLESAKNDFDSAFQRLRGNALINYQQLGLQFRLYSCEVLFNRGICQLYLGKIDFGLTDLYHARKAKETEEHNIIDQAVRARGKGFSVYSIPPGLLFRPSEIRLRQLKGINVFHDKLPFSSLPFTKRKNSIFLYQEDDHLPPTPTTPSSSSSSLSSLKNNSPPPPITFKKNISRRIIDSGFDSTNLKDNHRQSTNNTGRYSLNANNNNRPKSNNPYNNNIMISSTNSSQSSLASQHSTAAQGKLKIKCHYIDTRILLTSTDINFQELKSRISEKFNTSSDSIQLAYKDEEQEKVLMIDDEDLEMARQINRARSKQSSSGGNPSSTVEKLEIWI